MAQKASGIGSLEGASPPGKSTPAPNESASDGTPSANPATAGSPAEPAGGTGATTQSASQLADMELVISRLLQVGVSISSLVIFIGVVMLLVTGQTGYNSLTMGGLQGLLAYHHHLGAEFPTTLPEVLAGTLQLRPFAIIVDGVLLLILTPILRVAVSLITFFVEGDRAYVLISLYVLIVLIASFFIGRSIG